MSGYFERREVSGLEGVGHGMPGCLARRVVVGSDI